MIVDAAGSLVQSVGHYASDFTEINIFGKILKNECDDDFLKEIESLKGGIRKLLKEHFRHKFVFKSNSDI